MLEKKNILLIDDDNDVLQAYQSLLEFEGYHIICATDPIQAIEQIPENWQGIIISDIYMPKLSGWEVLERIIQKDKSLPVILITGHGDVPMAIDAMRKGAFYFIEKPIVPEKLLEQVSQALTYRRHQIDLRLAYQQALETHFIGKSNWIKKLRSYLQQLSETNLPVFIHGEPGTGRTLCANYLHQLSVTRFEHKQFIELSQPCDGDELQHYLQQSRQSTLIIKNIEFLSYSAQKLLSQYLSQNSSEMRFIGISLYSLNQLIADYHLLPELFYAFSLTKIECIPLSQRTADIEPLFRHYLAIICKKLNKKKPNIQENFIKQLLSQQWSGNITQLIHTAELYAVGVTVQNDNLHFMQEQNNELSLDEIVDEYEKAVLIDVLDRFQGRINDAANYLQISRKKLYLRMKRYDLNKGDYKE